MRGLLATGQDKVSDGENILKNQNAYGNLGMQGCSFTPIFKDLHRKHRAGKRQRKCQGPGRRRVLHRQNRKQNSGTDNDKTSQGNHDQHLQPCHGPHLRHEDVLEVEFQTNREQ